MTPLEWLKQEREGLEFQIERLRSGKFRIGNDSGSGWVDATPDHLAECRALLAGYDLVIAQAEGELNLMRWRTTAEQPLLPF